MDINQLINALKNGADALLVNGRMTVTPNLININHEIKHIIGLIIAHGIQVEERARQTREELDTSTGLLKFLQEVTNAREREIHGIRQRLIACQNERNRLQNERNHLVNANRDQANQLQVQQVQQRRIRDNLQQGNNRLTHQLAIERLTSRNLGRIRDRMQAQLAVLRIQAQWFRIRQANPIVNNPPPDNPPGYIHSIGIDPSAVAGNPAGWEKAMGILRACLTGPASRWYDANILGKRVRLRNILLRLAHGDEPAFKALAGNAGNCPVNTWVVGSPAQAHMTDGAVPGVNNPVTDVWPDYAIEGNRDIWLNRAGMEFTNDPLNHNVLGGGAGAGVAIAGGAGVGHPYVIPARPCHVLIKMRNEFPTQQNARRQLRFGNLFQENMPVRDFYDKVRRSAELLGYGNDVLVNQFLRGLNDDCAIEAERIGAERDIEELVGLLERVEKRKAELRLGRERRENIQYQRDRQIIPEQLPPVSQEPVILKPVQNHAVTQGEMSRLLQQQAEGFQSQIRQLQESLKARDVKPVYRPKPKPKPQYQDDWGFYEQDPYPDEGSNPFDEDEVDDRHLQQLFDAVPGRPAPRNTLAQRLAGKIAKRIAKARERREDAELNRAMRELSLDDHDDPMDTSNAIRGVPIELVQAPSKLISKSTKMVKIPAIKPSTNFTKTELLNLLKLADIRKIIQEIVYKILENYDSAPQEQPAVQEEYLGPTAMDIDVARLENTKDLLAINGNVNGVNIQCLADSCANVSFIQEEACHELKLKVDKSIKHSITGASGDGETFGIVKNVSINLSPPQSGSCIIKEDLVVLKGYKHREIGLSRACLRRYNYDIHESRNHIALTCNDKDYFIPIIPDANRT
ncbi:hypothetical protein RclHR1_04780001 [Rhizophagus clarus]|uniref:Aspartic peptidase DDI1-type domain-containing protein n=1 Tax=Rhizophagus clarus TaxID=94130 RepID=A0A2Z6RKA0_9GLOM|nr:hypothetical protein RclHR1_04780001 [Rhizophagus clarus]